MEKELEDLRENYGKRELNENLCPESPFELFELWINEAISLIQIDANAMALTTVGADGQPSSRMVLLKGFVQEKFYFYTHYFGRKGNQMKANPKVALLFWWKELERQVRIEGFVQKTSQDESRAYFQSRPKGSQIGSSASPQSTLITKEQLIQNFKLLEDKYRNVEKLPLPDDWGGYEVTPHLMEFWQGRPNRMHDRIEYVLKENIWVRCRLAP